jgi:nucleotide-binding universal stress UspA family protein
MNPTTPTPRPAIVVAAIDTASHADDVLRTAGLLAQALARAELHVLQVVESATPPLDPVSATLVLGPALQRLIAEAREDVEALAREAKAYFAGPTTAHVAVGSPGTEIVELAEKLGADVVVVGCEGKDGLRRLLLGSVSEYVARHAPCSVLVARPRQEQTEPLVEPMCTDCAAARTASRGQRLWCERHTSHHPHGTLHYEAPASFAVGSMFIRPEG